MKEDFNDCLPNTGEALDNCETLEGFFGKGSGITINAQKMKDEIRKEWPMQ